MRLYQTDGHPADVFAESVLVLNLFYADDLKQLVLDLNLHKIDAIFKELLILVSQLARELDVGELDRNARSLRLCGVHEIRLLSWQVVTNFKFERDLAGMVKAVVG